MSGEIYVPLKATEAPLLVSDNPSDDLQNNDVVSHMQALGFRRGSIVESVLGRKKNHITTCFYLLCDKIGLPNNQKTKGSAANNLASTAPGGLSGAHAGAQAGMAGAKEALASSTAAKKITRPSTAGSSRPSTAGSTRSGMNNNSARTSGFKRPASATRTRR